MRRCSCRAGHAPACLPPRQPRRQLISSAGLGILLALVRCDCGAGLSEIGDMDRDEAIKLLTDGQPGIKEWNRRLQIQQEGPDLNSADLSLANVRGANLRKANLSLADLSKANLRGSGSAGRSLSGPT